MKRVILILILASFVLTACGSADGAGSQGAEIKTTGSVTGDETAGEAETRSPADGDAPADDRPEETEGAEFALRIEDSIIEMDQNIKQVIDMLGEPIKEFKAPSCVFDDGIDRVFMYPGVQIHTYPKGDEDYIHTIDIKNDNIRTMGGIKLYASLKAVLNAYGNDFELESDMYTYTRGRTTLSFLIENDMVTSIVYGLVIESGA